MNGEEVQYTLTLKDLLTGKLHEAEHAAKGLETTIKGVEGILGALGIGFAIFEGAHFLTEGIHKVHELHAAEAQLKNTMENMGTYSEESFEKMVKGAGDLSKNILFSRTQVIELQGQLGLVGTIGEDEMSRLTKASADMATKFGVGLTEAGNMLAKAINNPEMARRLGMILKVDPVVMDHVQKLAKNGKEAEARMELLAIAESKVGGAAQAAFDADPMARFDKIMGKVKMSVGEVGMEILHKLLPSIESAANGIKNFIDFLKEHKDEVKAVAIGVGVATGAYILYRGALMAGAIAQGISTAAMAIFEAYAIASAASTETLTIAQWAWNVAMTANPIGVVVVAIGALIAGLVYAYEKVDWFRAGLWASWAVIKEFGHLVKNLFIGISTIIQGAFDLNPAEIARGLEIVEYNLANSAKRLGEAAKQGYAEGMADFHKDEKVTVKTKGATGKPGTAGADMSPKKATGTKSVVINISINKLIETFKIETTNLNESASKIGEHVTNTILQAVNDASIIADV